MCKLSMRCACARVIHTIDRQDAEDDEGFMQTRDAWSAKLRDDRLMRREVRKEHDDSGNEKSMHATVASLVDGLANERTQGMKCRCGTEEQDV